VFWCVPQTSEILNRCADELNEQSLAGLEDQTENLMPAPLGMKKKPEAEVMDCLLWL